MQNLDQYYLYVGRIVNYKRVDLLVKTFNSLSKKLIIIGDGFQKPFLKLIARKNITFLGYVNDEQLKKYYLKAKALVIPQEEDFGIIAAEAQALGVPVIAFSRGGALDTVINGVTGIYFSEQNEQSLAQAIEKFEKISFNRKTLIANANRFSKEVFKKEFRIQFNKIVKHI